MFFLFKMVVGYHLREIWLLFLGSGTIKQVYVKIMCLHRSGTVNDRINKVLNILLLFGRVPVSGSHPR